MTTLARPTTAALRRAPRPADALTPTPDPRSHDDAEQELAVLGGAGLRALWQPVLDLDTMRPVAVEALARGPVGTRWEFPDALFGRAAALGRTGQLDASCRRTALRAAVAGGVTGPATLFLNAEPEGLGADPSAGVEAELAELARRGVRVVLEITERDLTRHPAELLCAVARVRARGWSIALDDVGAERASLALMPFLAPDIIKLDLRLIQARTTVEIAETVNAVLAQAERTGAVILAEGIETPEHLALARSMGATLGQGWLLGRPAPLDPAARWAQLQLPTAAELGLGAEHCAPTSTPWDLVAASSRVRTSTKPLLVAMSLTLERQASAGGEAVVVLGTFQQDGYVTAHTRTRYAALARTAAFAAIFGVGVGTAPAPDVRGVDLAPGCELAQQWDVVVVGPHFAAALIARDHQDDPDEVGQDGRTFDYAVTYDRDTVLAAARNLMGRVTARA